MLLLLCAADSAAANSVVATEFGDPNQILVRFAEPVDAALASHPDEIVVYEEPDPDIRLPVRSVRLSDDRRQATLTFAEDLNQGQPHVVSIAATGATAEGEPLAFTVSKSYLGYLFSVLIGAMLIKNFVFTKYLGLCVFFGSSKKKETARGMGITFTIVMLVSAMISWFLFQFIMKPFNLGFLQVVVFIGLVSLTVQAVDTILRKVNPHLFNAFGVFLVLITTNCVIIAVPLMMAKENFSASETFMLSLGAGSGFLLAMYLMASVRERLDIARVPRSFQGLPIAFLVAGQFALAFLGFSGMNIF
jgi:electron transport complex protein RnfA